MIHMSICLGRTCLPQLLAQGEGPSLLVASDVNVHSTLHISSTALLLMVKSEANPDDVENDCEDLRQQRMAVGCWFLTELLSAAA